MLVGEGRGMGQRHVWPAMGGWRVEESNHALGVFPTGGSRRRKHREDRMINREDRNVEAPS